MEWVEAIRQSTVFQNWLFRGLFYSFLGLFTFVEYQREDVAAVKYGWTIDSIAITLVGLGIAYTFMVRYLTVQLITRQCLLTLPCQTQ